MRQPKPFFRKQTKSWYVQIGKRQINLGKNKKEAWAKYHEIMAEKVDFEYSQATVAQLLDAYLDWCLKRRSQGTFDKCKHYCQSFINCIGKRLRVRQLKPINLTKWIDLHPTWGACTQNDAISIIQRAFSWAIKQGLIDKSPIAHVEKPSRIRREVVYSEAEFNAILEASSDDIFRNLLQFMWETGCRPAEARTIEPKHVDLKNQMVVMEVILNKTKKGQRVIYLTERAMKIVNSQLDLTNGEPGPIFRNRLNNPWTTDAIKCRFQRIKKKLGMDRLCAYGIRHSYATEGLKNSVDPVSLSILMGHTDATMIARTYQHLAKDPKFLREQAKRARGEA